MRPVEGLDRSCIRISPAERLPRQTLISAGTIGGFHFVTAPGEWSTALAARVLERVRAAGGGDAMFVGYANDYTGYSLGEEDWWQGGYEASGALWGPRQGEYLAARAVEAFETFIERWNEPPWEEPPRVEPFSGYTYEPYVPEGAIMPGTIAVDVSSRLRSTDVATFTVRGSDPWLGVPVATLERMTGDGSFEPVIRSNGRPVDSESYDFWVDLAPEPAYADVRRATERTFAWTFHFPLSRRARSSIPPLIGPHRFRVRVPVTGGELVTETGVFVVE